MKSFEYHHPANVRRRLNQFAVLNKKIKHRIYCTGIKCKHNCLVYRWNIGRILKDLSYFK